MRNLSIVLHDDAAARLWEPFALTRPAGELLFGALTLRERAERVFDGACILHLAADHLRGFEEEGAAPVGTLAEVPRDRDRLFWLSRAVPAWGAAEGLGELAEGPIRIGGTLAGWFSPAGRDHAPVERLGGPAGAEATGISGRVLERVWELVSGNPDQIAIDVAALHPSPPAPRLDPGVHHWGDHPVVLGEGARVEPGAVLDTSEGPIWLDRGATVRAFTRLSGPAYVGPSSVVLGGPVGAVSLGPVCRVRGELAETVCLGYVNKQHDGHIGHAYLGRWVNLGAETTNSDLKNNYGTIRLWTPEGEMDTGEVKMGSLLGDHVKTGIGLLLNTGTVVGAGSNLYGAAMPPKYVPPFSWGTGEELVPYRVEKFMEVAERAMGRRQVRLSDALRGQLERAWRRARGGGEPDASGV
jgi:UDP-N-acetylglucosamine diphosphorylase/glucosamine-1-phosphate N-acetyltransferase